MERERDVDETGRTRQRLDPQHLHAAPVFSLLRKIAGGQLPAAGYFPEEREDGRGVEMLRVESLASPSGFVDVSFALHAGEVVGMAGLVGAGRSEVALALFGLDPSATGRTFVREQAV